jgi:hypothetical protein
MAYRWTPLLGRFDHEEDVVIFRGRVTDYLGQPGPAIGNLICDQRFSGGTISAKIKFNKITEFSACELILYHHPSPIVLVTAGIGSMAPQMFSVRLFSNDRWYPQSSSGDRANLMAGCEYDLYVRRIGSRITMTVDGVDVINTDMQVTLPQGQVGIWCRDTEDIIISNFLVKVEPLTAFVVMQFTEPYFDLYTEVIDPICTEFGLTAVRADETFGPGLIVADIVRQIAEATVVIAEISPPNPNVYYEVGYAHAMNKPTILIAERDTKLPFDVSPFRTLFYSNSIQGKTQVEQAFRKHLQAVLMK